MTKKEIGELGEKIAAKFFLEKGWVFVEKNFYKKNFGEIDLIFKDISKGNQIVFIEVKTRTNGIFGEGFEAVQKSKLRKMAKTGEIFCFENGIDFDETRFDIVSILLKMEQDIIGNNCKIKHLEKIL